MIKSFLSFLSRRCPQNTCQNVFLLTFLLQSLAVFSDDCSWVIAIVEKDKTTLKNTVILPGKSYFVRVQVECHSKLSLELAREVALTGTTPTVHIESKAIFPNSEGGYYVKQFEHIIKTVLVELGNQTQCHCQEYTCLSSSSKTCFCGNEYPTCTGNRLRASDTCCQTEQVCLSSGFLCNLAWLAPLPLGEGVTVLYCSLEDTGTGPDISSPSFVFHVDGFHNNLDEPINNTLGSKVDYIPSVEGGPTPLNCMPQLSSACVIAGLSQSNVVFYSSSEFAVSEVIEVRGILSGTSVCTEHYPSLNVIKGTFSFLDVIILNTPVGLFEVRGKLSSQSGVRPGTSSSVLQGCIKHLIGPTEVKSQLTTILAIGENPHHQKIFIASKQPGTSLNFTELLDTNNYDVCQFLRGELLTTGSEPCTVITASILYNERKVIMVELSTSLGRYHLVQFDGSTTFGQWSVVSSIPSHVPDSNGDVEDWVMVDQSMQSSSDHALERPILNGMSHTAIISNGLFVWGNMLLYSDNAGRTIQRLTSFRSSSNITIFTSSLDGTYALLTDTNELWLGVVGSARLVKIESSPEFWPGNPGFAWDFNANRSVITMFFDSMDQLQQVVSSGNTTERCISRFLVPVEDIMTAQNLHQERLNNWKDKVSLRSSNTSCPLNQTTSDSDPIVTAPVPYVTRSCPYAMMKVVAPRSTNTSRILRFVLDPPRITDSNLLYSEDDVLEYLRVVSDTHSLDTLPSPLNEKSTDSELPGEISLHRLESYSFDLYLYLKEDEDIGAASISSWSMDHLKISIHVSDPSLINVTSTREELVPYGAVKYQVKVQDKGVNFPQHPPGELLVPISLHIQTWNSALSCVEESQGGSRHFTGSQVMTVFLGCPANRKVVFDDQMSMAADGKNHYCRPGETVPCFLFDLGFYPLFNIVDLTNGHTTPFEGQYTLKVVGGGLDLDSIRDYSPQEQENYNFRTTGSPASLVWAAQEKTLATVPVFNRSTNAMQWLCGTQSPCANIDPKFPDNAEYFFKVEFSNKGVDISNCDYTVRFIIRVHGLPPGSLNPSSVIVLSCIGIMVTVILTLFIFKRQDYKLWRSLKGVLLDLSHCCHGIIVGEQKVAPEDELEMEGMDAVNGATKDTYRNPVGIAWDYRSKNANQHPQETSKDD